MPSPRPTGAPPTLPLLLPLLRGRPALPRGHARPAALAACSLPRRTIPHAVPRASLTSRRAVRPTGRHVQSKFDLSTRRVLLPSHRGRPALPRGHARPAALAAYALPRRTTPADLHLLDGRPEEGRAATQRDPPRPTSAPPTSRGHTRTCPARPPTPDLPHSPTSNSRTHHARRAGRPTAAARRSRRGDLQAGRRRAARRHSEIHCGQPSQRHT